SSNSTQEERHGQEETQSEKLRSERTDATQPNVCQGWRTGAQALRDGVQGHTPTRGHARSLVICRAERSARSPGDGAPGARGGARHPVAMAGMTFAPISSIERMGVG